MRDWICHSSEMEGNDCFDDGAGFSCVLVAVRTETESIFLIYQLYLYVYAWMNGYELWKADTRRL